MKRKHSPRTRMTDAPVDGPGLQQAISPEMRLAADIRQAYQDETDQDQRSLKRVFARLQQDHLPGEQRASIRSGTAYPAERISSLDETAGQWRRRIALLAATLCLLVLVAGFVSLAHVARITRSTVVGAPMPPRATGSAGPLAIRKALLCILPVGGEGVGPGLSGLTPSDHFQVGQQFWLFFLVDATHAGTVSVRWYADGLLYHTSERAIPAFPQTFPVGTPLPTPARNAPVQISGPSESNFGITYGRPAHGKVELYWNGQLALTLYFVVHT